MTWEAEVQLMMRVPFTNVAQHVISELGARRFVTGKVCLGR